MSFYFVVNGRLCGVVRQLRWHVAESRYSLDDCVGPFCSLFNCYFLLLQSEFFCVWNTMALICVCYNFGGTVGALNGAGEDVLLIPLLVDLAVMWVAWWFGV